MHAWSEIIVTHISKYKYSLRGNARMHCICLYTRLINEAPGGGTSVVCGSACLTMGMQDPGKNKRGYACAKGVC